MNQAKVKSATTAGLFGIFLGFVGVHNWYLEEKSKGIIHVSLSGGGLLFVIIGFILMPKDVVSLFTSSPMTMIAGLLTTLGWISLSVSSIWGFVEGIMIMSKGDAGLAARGFTVANAAPAAEPNPASTVSTPDSTQMQLR